MASFKASALRNLATGASQRIESVAGRKGNVFGGRLMEVNGSLANGWGAPELREYGALSLRPQISAFHYGLVCFDHFTVARGKDGELLLFRPDMSLQRLDKSRQYLRFADYCNDELLELLKAFVRADEPSVPSAAGERFLVRTTIIGNNNNLSAGPADEFKLYTFGSCLDTNATAKPLKLKADNSVRRSWRGGTGELSMGGNYANQIFQERKSREEGFDRHLWLVDDDAITTAGDSNFFAVFRRGESLDVVTPATNGTMNPGVTRDSILQLLRKEGGNVTVSEQQITAGDLRAASKDGSLVEAFSASTATMTRPIGHVWFEGEMLEVPTPADGVGARMKKALGDIQEGRVASDWVIKA